MKKFLKACKKFFEIDYNALVLYDFNNVNKF